MDTNKVLDFLENDLLCEHKIDITRGMPFHNHNGYELFLHIRGNVNYYTEQEGHHMNHGDLLCIKPYDFHRRELLDNEPFERYIINLKENFIASLSTANTDLSAVFYRLLEGKINILHLTGQEVRQFTYYCHQIKRGLTSLEYGNDILVETYLKQLLVLVNQCANSTRPPLLQNIMPQIVSDTIAYIDLNLTEKITLEVLSSYLHHNGTYIGRCFKNVTGISLQQYIIGKRISLAEKYLLEGYSLNDSCYLSGFNDYSNFCRTFNKQVGMSPKKFQQHGA